MDSSFSFLDRDDAGLVTEVVGRRDPALLATIRREGTVSQSIAEKIMYLLDDELNNNLDDDWEPTKYGRSVSAAMANFNAARLREWP